MAEELKYVEVEEERYNELLEAERFLHALEANGVDNWIGYEDVQDMFQEEEE